MTSVDQSGTFALGGLRVRRLGYVAMHLSGPGHATTRLITVIVVAPNPVQFAWIAFSAST